MHDDDTVTIAEVMEGFLGSKQVEHLMVCTVCGEPLARGTGEPYTMTNYPEGVHRSCSEE